MHFSVVAGLGNPGTKYAGTRHNIGFEAIDLFLTEAMRGDEWKVLATWKQKGQALVSELKKGSESLWLIKPQSFMNLSGQPIGELMRFYKLQAAELLVLQDEIDLPLGKIRLKAGGGDGGHNGLKSITSGLGSNAYARIRIGVGRPESAIKPADATAGNVKAPPVRDWVLGRFDREEVPTMEEVLSRTVKAVECCLEEGLLTAQNKFNS